MLARTFFLSLLVLDPIVLSAATTDFQLGANYSEWAPTLSAMATDSAGALYLVWPCQVSSAGVLSDCVTKVSADGKTIIWQNTLGFGVQSYGTAMAADPNGGVYLIPGVQPHSNVYVAKLGPSGTGIAWKTAVSGYNGGSLVITADSQGRTYVAELSSPSSVIRLNATGSAVDYTAQVPGLVVSVAADGTGGAFVTGSTTTLQNVTVPFLARVAPDGSIAFNTPLPALSTAGAVAVDPDGNAVVCGTVASGSIVVVRFNSAGAITLSSIVGFSTANLGSGNFVLDAAGNAYITGSSDALKGAGVFYLIQAKNSLATCGSEWLSVVAPDGSILQTTYAPPGIEPSTYAPPDGGSDLESPLVAMGPNSSVFVAQAAAAEFSPTRAGPFPQSTSTPYYLWNLSLDANAHTFPLACLGNAATYLTGPIAPGGFVTLYGNGLGPQQGVQMQATLEVPFPTQSAGVAVTFDGTPAPLLWVQDGQINVVAPWALTPGQSTSVCVTYNGVKTNCLSWPVAATAAAVFTVDGLHASALNQDGSVNSANNPAQSGSIVSVFATGLGPITPPQSDGTLVGFPLPTDVLPVTVALLVAGGIPPILTPIPTQVTYAGPAPGLVAGASQINFQIVPVFDPSANEIYAVSSPASQQFSPASQQFEIYVAVP
jgi:uncharacterized protein (TIGR03437 family)